MIPQADTVPHDVETPPASTVIVDRPGLVEPARCMSSPSGKRRSTAAHGEDKVPSPGHYPFHLQLQQPGEEGYDLPGRYRAHGVEPHPHPLIADGLRLIVSPVRDFPLGPTSRSRRSKGG